MLPVAPAPVQDCHAVCKGCEDYNSKVRQSGGFVLPHPPRDSRTFPTATGEAMLTVNVLETIQVPPGRLLLQSMRSHDQFNTTMYSLNDRYRGVKKGRHVLFVNPEDFNRRGFADGGFVDIHSEAADGVDRALKQFRIIAYPTARGCVAAYFRRQTSWSRWIPQRKEATPRRRSPSSSDWSPQPLRSSPEPAKALFSQESECA